MDFAKFSSGELNNSIWSNRFNLSRNLTDYIQFVYCVLKQNYPNSIEEAFFESYTVVKRKLSNTKDVTLFFKLLVMLHSKGFQVETIDLREFAVKCQNLLGELEEKEIFGLGPFFEYCNNTVGTEISVSCSEIKKNTITNLHKAILERCIKNFVDFRVEVFSKNISKDVVIDSVQGKSVKPACIEVNGPLHFYRDMSENYLSVLSREAIMLSGFECLTVDFTVLAEKQDFDKKLQEFIRDIKI